MSYLEQEIDEQPAVLERLLAQEVGRAQEAARAIRQRGPAFAMVAARGTSSHAATYGQYLWGSRCGLPVALATPSLYTIYRQPPRLRDALVVGISQSGHSPDIIEVVAEGRRQGALTLGITNDPQSPLASTAEFCLFCQAGEERSVAATKTYTAQLTALALLATQLGDDPRLHAELARLPEQMAQALGLAREAQQRAERYRHMGNCILIGRGYNYATALEVSLKLKELTYTPADPYSAADFMHGPLALIEPGSPVLLFAPSGAAHPGMLALAEDLRQREAELVIVSDRQEVLDLAHTPFRLPAGVPEWLSPMVAVAPGQLFTVALTRAKGYDLDHPRSLHKVTRTI